MKKKEGKPLTSHMGLVNNIKTMQQDKPFTHIQM